MYKINLYMPVTIKLTDEGVHIADEYGYTIGANDCVNMPLISAIQAFGGDDAFGDFSKSKYIKDLYVAVSENSFSSFSICHSKEMESLSEYMDKEENKSEFQDNLIKYRSLDVEFQKKKIRKEKVKLIKFKNLLLEAQSKKEKEEAKVKTR